MDPKQFIDKLQSELTIVRADNKILQDKLNEALSVIMDELRLNNIVFDETKDQSMVRKYHDILKGLELDSKGFVIGKGTNIPLEEF